MTDTVLCTEIFYSVQGEGLYVGKPSIFIRTFGCTLRCPGFGGKRTENKMLPLESAEGIESLKEIPIPDVGCDSYPSWDKNFAHLATRYNASDLLKECLSHWPIASGRAPHIVITGGEPLLPGYQRFWAEAIDLFKSYGFTSFTFETNGSIPLTPELQQVVEQYPDNFTFSVSPKLSNSGEKEEKALKPEAVASYVKSCPKGTYLKFVVREEKQILEVNTFLRAYRKHLKDDEGFIEIYLMPEGGTSKELSLTEKRVAEMCMAHGWSFSPRLHINLFGNAWET